MLTSLVTKAKHNFSISEGILYLKDVKYGSSVLEHLSIKTKEAGAGSGSRNFRWGTICPFSKIREFFKELRELNIFTNNCYQ